jgi:hypothetical protein
MDRSAEEVSDYLETNGGKRCLWCGWMFTANWKTVCGRCLRLGGDWIIELAWREPPVVVVMPSRPGAAGNVVLNRVVVDGHEERIARYAAMVARGEQIDFTEVQNGHDALDSSRGGDGMGDHLLS